MHRIQLSYLQEWLIDRQRQPLIIRGARQVGKTWLVRQFAQLCGKKLIELNFEENRELLSLFSSNDPEHILMNISAALKQTIDEKNSLLFLDELQVNPELISKFRWFAEKMPGLPVIGAGSLLDFALSEFPHSVPVGRVGYMYMEPLSFDEYLLAKNENTLIDYLKNYSLGTEIPTVIHQQCLSLFKEYTLIGGMPAAVSSWINDKSFEKVNRIHSNLLTTYRDDFTKYRGRINIERLEELIVVIPRMLTEKFIYSHVNPLVNAASIHSALKLLMKARVCHQVISTAANGVPIAAETNEKFFKMIFIDIGMVSAALGVSLHELDQMNELIFVNNGQIAEQAVGQLLRTQFPFYVDPSLHYWLRQEKGSSAEIDYLIQYRNKLIPIEVKAGSTGSLKSLHLFMQMKQLPFAVRINSDFPSLTPIKVKDRFGKTIEYDLLSMPFYLIGQLQRLIESQK
jgi:hypothetical protein